MRGVTREPAWFRCFKKVKMSDESENSTKLVLVSKDTQGEDRKEDKSGQERGVKKRQGKCSPPRCLDNKHNDKDQDKKLEIS